MTDVDRFTLVMGRAPRRKLTHCDAGTNGAQRDGSCCSIDAEQGASSKKCSTEPFSRKGDVLPPIGGDVVDCVGADLSSNLATRCNVNRIKTSQANSGTMSTN